MRPLLGTFVEIRAGGPASHVTDGIAAAFAAIERVQRLMSFHDPRSDVSRINSSPVGYEIPVDRETYGVLHYARELGHRSSGAFDIAIAPTLVAAGLLPSPPLGGPPTEGVDSAASPARFSDLELLADNAVRWRTKGAIDLGGIAKGYAVDVAVTALRSHGITHGLVNAGGDLRGFGESWPIQLRAPHQPTMLLEVGSLRDAAIATSAGYFCARRAESDPIGPLVDPWRKICVAWGKSISVIANQCMAADALTKVVRLAPAVSLAALLEHYDAQAVAVDQLGVHTCGRDWLQGDTTVSRLPTGKAAVG